ncbi:glucan endo-1,3-beta-glucosidase 8-like [Cornus florida]|uniref:glucan endo-1,3-beta-glucosidase 8-like n=1 Tax=Cornus florida TaxID=4283 RepID=UPI002896C671|nr:glucan endo-1,3-beta-glucosidase 8-like [Cornus florida]
MPRVWFFIYLFFVGFLGCVCVNGLGVNWGTISTHQLPPKTVVQMLKDNGIEKVKLFDADETILSALAGTGIEVMVAITNNQLAPLNKFDRAKEWVKENVTKYHVKGGVDIKYVAVGNEPFLKAYNNSFSNVTFPALKNIQNALNDAGVGDTVKATVPFNADVYESPDNSPVPSSGRFRADILGQMKEIVEFLDKNKAPFMVNIYPFLSLYGHDDFPIDYAFFDGASKPIVDGSISYTNVFEANYDTCVSALKAMGVGNMSVFVGEVGWPTDGEKNANIQNAYRYYSGLLPRLAGDKGTPLRPGYIEVYLFGLLDEDGKSILPGNFERHWGIFTFDGQPKFPVDFKGENKSLLPAQDVKYLPKKWCMHNPNAKDSSKLAEAVEYACMRADCTSLSNGSSCENLDPKANASYAFNMYFQVNDQKDESCDFEGLAVVTTKNLSQGNCSFPIQLAPEKKKHSDDSPSPSPSPSSSPDEDNKPPSPSQAPSSSSGGNKKPLSSSLVPSFVALAFFTPTLFSVAVNRYFFL